MPDGKKDLWDKINATTPLILGVAITGIGALFTQLYNNRQLELNKIEALDKLRPLLTSTKPEEREFAYASFRALGYEQIAIRMLQVNKDQSGRAVLVQMTKTASPEIKAEASSTLKGLDEARKLVYVNEFGTATPPAEALNPRTTAHLDADEAWAKSTTQQLGISSPLAISILEDTSAQMGSANAQRLKDGTSAAVPPPLSTRDKQAAWLTEYLDERDRFVKERPAFARSSAAVERRLSRYRELIKSGDWDLRTTEAPPPK